jgi:GNAT superfamily N-acetyltransferase
LRTATASDAGFLAEMLAVALDWRPGTSPRPSSELMPIPEIWHYIDGWPREGDFGLVAEVLRPVGAVWWRFFDGGDPGYGFVDAVIPEISIGVTNEFRLQGIGQRLLTELISEGRARGVPGLCLSVEPDNPALRLYERFGFASVGGNGGSTTMLLHPDD